MARPDRVSKGQVDSSRRTPTRDRSIKRTHKGQVDIPKFGYSRRWPGASRCGWLEA